MDSGQGRPTGPAGMDRGGGTMVRSTSKIFDLDVHGPAIFWTPGPFPEVKNPGCRVWRVLREGETRGCSRRVPRARPVAKAGAAVGGHRRRGGAARAAVRAAEARPGAQRAVSAEDRAVGRLDRSCQSAVLR